jgi:cytochrome c2
MIRLPRLARVAREATPLDATAWHVVVLALLVLAPSQLWLHTSFWTLAPRELPQVLAVVAGYLAFALALHTATDRGRSVGVFTVIAAGVACFAAATAMLATRTDLPLSRGLYAGSSLLGIALAILPYFVARRRHLILGVLAFGVVSALVFGAQHRNDTSTHRRIRGTLYVSDIRYFRRLIPTPGLVRGGGIVSYGSEFLLVNGVGDFYRLRWNQKGDSLLSHPMGLHVPTGHDQMMADLPNPTSAPRLRAAGLIIDSLSNPMRVFVSHMYWDRDDHCITLRVSVTDLDSATLRGSAHGDWKTIYETKPCLKPEGSFEDIEAGGRLAWLPDRTLLLTVGDFGFDGLTSRPLSQLMDNDYGKILRLDLKGGREIYSIGHRNPQGLVVARDGRIWETEHGPQGGDEINLIVKGGNYGWPFATYGTQYGLDYWPLAPNSHDHGKYVEPAHVFVPSVGVSAMIEMSDRQFPRSAGDLYIVSLGGQATNRARVVGDRIIYVRSTSLDRRMRDVTEGSDGRILIWTDEGDVIVLSRADWELTGAEVYATCSSCHEPSEGTSQAAAPTLHGVLGRRVASVPGYQYSAGLKAVGGVWTIERLSSFLMHPAGFAPGTAMRPWGVTEERQRRAIVGYLADLK